MKKSQLSLVVSAILLAGGGFANADESVTLTDQQMDAVTAAGGFTSSTSLNFDKSIFIDINADVNAVFNVEPNIVGNTALSNATADAQGNSDTFTETFVDAETTDSTSQSAAEAVAVTGG